MRANTQATKSASAGAENVTGLFESADGHWHEKLRNGTTVLIRPIRESDLEMERRFIKDLSPQSRRFRFLGEIKSPSPVRVKNLKRDTRAETDKFMAHFSSQGDSGRHSQECTHPKTREKLHATCNRSQTHDVATGAS